MYPKHVEVPGATTLLRVPDRDEIPKMADDGYPDIISDQRHFFGVETVHEVEDAWLDCLEVNGIEAWWDPQHSAVPYINRARWLIDCPHCGAGAFAWDANPNACCLGCGLIVKVVWQLPMVRSEAIRLLAVRPLAACNWNAHQGETLDTLERENLLMLHDATTTKDGLRVPVSLVVPDSF